MKRSRDKSIKYALKSKLSLKEDKYQQERTSTIGYTTRKRG
jgi:hypothetical protein